MEIRRLTNEEFFAFYSQKVTEHFRETFSYHVFDVRTPREIENFERLRNGVLGRDNIHLVIYDENNEIMGWSTSHQGTRPYELYTLNSVILPQHRRKGLYSTLIQRTIEEGRKLGYQVITSHHVTSNNAVIIAKLRQGFRITGMEIFDDVGTVVKLNYYLNAKRAKLQEFRTGYIRPDEEIRSVLKF